MRKILTAISLGICLMFAGAALAENTLSAEEITSKHMVAEAKLTAHFIDAAIKAGMSAEAINSVLADVAQHSVITEFWVSDEHGQIAFTNIPGTSFSFPADPNSGTQAAPFAALLHGGESVVIQALEKRELDGAPFKYVGVAGVDKARIVQVGISAGELNGH